MKKNLPHGVVLDNIQALGTLITRFKIPMKIVNEINETYDKYLEELVPANDNLAGQIKEGRFPGFITAVARKGRVVHFETQGFSDVEKQIPLQLQPKPLQFNDAYWHVVTEANFDEFIEKFKKENGNAWVFYALSVRSYESMALNLAEIKRYIEQQKQIIVYYEEAVKPKQPSVKIDEKTQKEKSKFLQKIYNKIKPKKEVKEETEEVTDGTVQ